MLHNLLSIGGANVKRLIESYAIGSWTCWNLVAVWIAITMPGKLVDIKVFRIRIVGKVRFGSSAEILISNDSNAVPPFCSIDGEARVCCLSCGYMVNAIDNYELILIIAQSSCWMWCKIIVFREIRCCVG
jgi:hypothetical protein